MVLDDDSDDVSAMLVVRHADRSAAVCAHYPQDKSEWEGTSYSNPEIPFDPLVVKQMRPAEAERQWGQDIWWRLNRRGTSSNAEFVSVLDFAYYLDPSDEVFKSDVPEEVLGKFLNLLLSSCKETKPFFFECLRSIHA